MFEGEGKREIRGVFFFCQRVFPREVKREGDFFSLSSILKTVTIPFP